MALIWGTNYSIVKRAFEEIDPQAFNAVRMLIASTVFVAVIAYMNRSVHRHSEDAPMRSMLHTPAALISA